MSALRGRPAPKKKRISKRNKKITIHVSPNEPEKGQILQENKDTFVRENKAHQLSITHSQFKLTSSPSVTTKLSKCKIPAAKDCFSCLGKDILLHLKLFLDDDFYRTIPVLNRISKNLVYSLPWDLWKAYTPDQIFDLFGNNPTLPVTNLSLFIADNVGLNYLYPLLPRMTKFQLNNAEFVTNYELPDIDFLYRAKALKELTINRYVDNIDVLTSLTQLISLNINSMRSHYFSLRLSPLNSLHNLQFLTLNVYRNNVNHILVNFPSLREVELYEFNGETPSFTGCPALQKLCLSSSSQNIILVPLSQEIQLIELAISGPEKLTIDPQFTVPYLQHLSLMNVFVNDHKLSFLSQCKDLICAKLYCVSPISVDSHSYMDITVLTTLPALAILQIELPIFDANILAKMPALTVLTTLPALAILQIELPIFDANILAKMPALTELDVQIYNFSMNVISLPSLQGYSSGLIRLSMRGTNSLQCLTICPNLKFLELQRYSVDQTSYIQHCTKLEVLTMILDEIGPDLDFFTKLTELQRLDVQSRHLTYNHLRFCTKLTHLTIINNLSDSFIGIGSLGNLTCLRLDSSNILTTEGLEQATNLKSLHLEAPCLEHFILNKPLLHLQEFTIENMETLLSISGLSNCPNITRLRLLNTRITSLYPIEGLRYLEYLEINRNDLIKRLPLLHTCPRLSNIALYNTLMLEDFTGLSGSKSLNSLIVNGSSISNISFLPNCPNLTNLSLSNTEVKDLTPMINCDNLYRIALIGNRNLCSVSVLAKCKRLTHITLNEMPKIQYISSLSLCPRLRYINLTDCANIEDLHTFVSNCPSLILLIDAKGSHFNMLNPWTVKYLSGNV